MKSPNLPKLITFDGEARSGKGTVVQAAKDYLRDECGLKPMLIDRGQTFRSLVVGANRASVDLDNPDAIDEYFSNPDSIEAATQLVKDIYHMDKDEREGLLYTNAVGVASAKIGGRPASQDFAVTLTKKWLRDAADEGYDVVLLDGRCLEQLGHDLQADELCQYVLGLYFICDSQVGARRTLGYAAKGFEELTDAQQTEVTDLIEQIKARDHADKTRKVEQLTRPQHAIECNLPTIPSPDSLTGTPPMLLIDSSAEISKDEMSLPVSMLVAQILKSTD